jgi:hypothetical protein
MAKRLTKRQLKRLQTQWNNRLASEGLGILGDAHHWTFPGITANGVGFTSLQQTNNGEPFDATHLFESDALATHGHAAVAETTHATFWRKFSHAAHALRDHDQAKPFLVALGDCGYIKHAAKQANVTMIQARHWLNGFCADHGFDRRRVYYKRSAAPVDPYQPGPVRHLSKSEIKRLKYTPPIKAGDGND